MLPELQTKMDQKVLNVSQENKKFLDIQEHYKSHKDKKSYDEMFLMVLKCCMSLMKKKAGGMRKDLQELATDATCEIMNRVKHGYKRGGHYHIDYLPTVCHFAVKKALYNDKQKMIDKELSITDLGNVRYYDEKEF